MKTAKPAFVLGFAVLVGPLLGAAPATAQSPTATPDRERMTSFVHAHRALNDARDEFHGKVGRLHDEQGRERARQEMEQQIVDALEANGLTRESYDAMTLLISMDGEARTLFEEILAEIEGTRGDGPANGRGP